MGCDKRTMRPAPGAEEAGGGGPGGLGAHELASEGGNGLVSESGSQALVSEAV